MDLAIIEEKFDEIQGADFLTEWVDLLVVDWRQKRCNEEFRKFIENNMFASKRLNLFVEYSG